MTADLRAVLFDFDGTLWDSETAVFGVFRDLYEEHGHELTLPTWSAAIGTLGGFDLYAELGRLRGLPFDVDEVRARTEERIREAAERAAAPGVAGFLRQLDEAGVPRALVSSDRSEWLVTHLERLGWPDGWSAMVCADGDASRPSRTPPLPGRARAARGPGRLDVRDRGLAERDPGREGRRDPLRLRPERGHRRARPVRGRPAGPDVRGPRRRGRVERTRTPAGSAAPTG